MIKNPFPEFKTSEVKIEFQGEIYYLTQPNGADFEFSQKHVNGLLDSTPIRTSMLFAIAIIKNSKKQPLFDWDIILAGLNEEQQRELINQALDFMLGVPAPLCRMIIDATQELAGLTTSHEEKAKNS